MISEGIHQAVNTLFAVCAISALIGMLGEDRGLYGGVRMASGLVIALNVLRLAGQIIKAL